MDNWISCLLGTIDLRGLVYLASRYTMVPASVDLGFSASIIWVGQGTYLTLAAVSHAKDCSQHEGTIIGNFNGEF
ncbi:UNC93-like protein 3 [Acorus calamus]|uniref:UNC93-like protein 3 n=1 Tax=Acorus calamus TaxID=4465 RepID=A0AAV9C9N5_ACOCL|nr:UNC93-like protein 3 [Acorus calamus]